MVTKDMERVIEDVRVERVRQVDVEGWSPERDDAEHFDYGLAAAAACYANPIYLAVHKRRHSEDITPEWAVMPLGWPPSWSPEWYKPTDRRRDLVKAAALLVAEIERLDRAERRAMPQVEKAKKEMEELLRARDRSSS